MNSIFQKNLTPLLQVIFFPILLPFLIYLGFNIIQNGKFHFKGHLWEGSCAYTAGLSCLLWGAYILIAIPKVYFKSEHFQKIEFIMLILSVSMMVLTYIQMFIVSLKIIISEL